MKAHSSVGRKYGIDDQEIEKLIALNKDAFEYREWLALKFAQDTAFLGGGEPAGEYVEDYQRLYTKKERKYILKIIRFMMFTNYWANSAKGEAWRLDLENETSCSI